MSEIIFDTQVREIAELDTENPFYDYVKYSMLPNEGSGDIINDLATNEPMTFDDPSSATNVVVWNPDGSVSPSENSTVSNDNTVVGLRTEVVMSEYGELYETRSRVLLLDVYSGASVSNSGTLWDDANNSGDSVYVTIGAYNNNFKVATSFNYIGNTYTSTEIGRKVITIHINPSNSSCDVYDNGVVVYQGTGLVIDVVAAYMDTFHVGLGNVNTKTYMQSLLVHPTGSFTQEEITSIVNSPYQLFKTKSVVEKEYGLVAPIASYLTFSGLAAPTGDFNIEFEYKSNGRTAGDVEPVIGKSVDASFNIKVTNANTQANNLISFRVGAVNYNTSLDSIDLEVFNHYKYVYNGTDLKFYFNGILTDTIIIASTDMSGTNLLWKASTDVTTVESELKYFKFTDHNDPTNSRFWDFNQTYGNTVVDHYNGAVATLVNFPADSGYVRGYGVSDGLGFGSTEYAELPFTLASTSSYEVELVVNFPLVITETFKLFISNYGDAELIFQVRTGSAFSVQTINGGLENFFGTPVGLEGTTATLRLVVDGVNTKLFINNETTPSVDLLRDDSLGVTHGIDYIRVNSYVHIVGGHNNDGFGIKSVQVTDHTNSLNVYYDFTAITNSTTVPETINGQDGTLVNFTDVYVPEKNKVLVGQEVPSTTQINFTTINISGYCRITGAFKTPSVLDGTPYILTNGASSSHQIYLSNAGKRFYVRLGSSSINDVVQTGDIMLPNTYYYFEILRAVDGLSFEVFLNSESVGTNTITSGQNILLSNVGRGTSSKEILIYNIIVEDSAGEALNLDFTQEAGDTILDTSGNDNHGSVVGGSLRRIYDYSGYGEIAGYRFEDNYASLPAWTCPASSDYTIEVVMSLTQDPSGAQSWAILGSSTGDFLYKYLYSSRTRWSAGGADIELNAVDTQDRIYTIVITKIVNEITLTISALNIDTLTVTETFVPTDVIIDSIGSYNTNSAALDGIIYTLKVNDLTTPSNSLNFDFTTGDQSKIIETVSGNHAVITGDSTVKWQPIVPVDVYTDADYADIVLFGNARGASSNLQHYKFSGTQELTSDFDHRTDFVDGFIIEGAGNDFVGDFSDTGVAKITRDVAYTLHLFDDRTGRGEYKNLIIDSKGDSDFGSFVTGTLITLGNVGLHNRPDNSINANKYIIDKSHIHSIGRPISADSSVTLTNSMVTGTSSDGLGLMRSRGRDIHVINNVFLQNGTDNTFDNMSTITGSNNISNKADIDGIVGTGSVDFTNAFVDEASNDYRINRAWADTNLVGQGWNGSDIASFAYYTAVVAITAAISGTAVTPTSTEVDIVNGGNTLIITLTGDTWATSGANFDAQRQNLINGLVSAQSELTGFNNEVTANELVTSVVRTSDTVVTITFTAAISYDINSTETITTTIPASSLITSSSDIVADSTFTITATATGFKIIFAINSNNLIGAM